MRARKGGLHACMQEMRGAVVNCAPRTVRPAVICRAPVPETTRRSARRCE